MMVEVAHHFREAFNLTFASIEPFNEPISTWWTSRGTQEGCHFEHGTQASVLKELGNALLLRGGGAESSNKTAHWPQVAVSDENTYTEALATWSALESAGVDGVADQINVHGYEYGGGRRDLLYAAAKKAGKKLWNSE